jgi:NAD(P)-dependent dehydrogenase (short-subunit alcohol dehydrogenase family)
VAVITGGSRGIGLAIAQQLSEQGCQVVISGRDAAALKTAAKKISRTGGRVLAKVADVRQPGSVGALFKAIAKEFGHIDVLINNAGISHEIAEVQQLSLTAWQDVIQTNLTGMFLCTQAALPFMRSGGTIVNNLSIAAKQVFAGQSGYCAAKHGALGFTNTLREELRQRGIRVIALLPGATNTDIWQQFWPKAPRERMLTAETVATAVVNAILLPANSTVEEITLMPTRGKL